MKSAIAYVIAMSAVAYMLAGCAEVRDLAHLGGLAGQTEEGRK